MKKYEILTILVIAILLIVSVAVTTYRDKRNGYHSETGQFECWVEINDDYEYMEVESFKYYRENYLYVFWFYDNFQEPIATYSSEPIRFQCWVD